MLTAQERRELERWQLAHLQAATDAPADAPPAPADAAELTLPDMAKSIAVDIGQLADAAVAAYGPDHAIVAELANLAERFNTVATDLPANGE